MLPFLSRWTSLGRESPFHHKVVYSVDDGCSLRQKSIHHERENTMLFSSICTVNGQPFLRHSIVWLFALRKHSLWKQPSFFAPGLSAGPSGFSRVLKIYLFPVLHLLIKCLVTKLRTNRNVHQVLFLSVNSIEKWMGMKNPVGELIRGLTCARNFKKQCMYMENIFPKLHFWFI